MFDDQPLQNQPGIPGNLPVEPEDIFGVIDPALVGAPPTPADVPDMAVHDQIPPLAPPESILASQTALEVGVLKPKSMTPEAVQVPPVMQQAGSPGMPPMGDSSAVLQASTPQTGIDYDMKSPSAAKGIVTIVIAVVVVVIIGGGGWWIYSNFIRVVDIDEGPAVVTDTTFEEEIPLPSDTDTGIPLIESDGTTTEPEDIEIEEPTPDEEAIDDQVLFGEPIDKDADGLDDATEVKFNTDPNNWDSDGDELSDGDEVNVWKTNPLNPDSDGDSFPDGAEIKNGYNPAGPGKLFEVPTSTEI
ncbi:MAG: hypothetical protein ABII02_04310 [Candidatus Magasanikbacteria bacterium]